MLSNRHFYFSLTRKYVVAFGNMFNNVSMIRTNRDTKEELERIKVPLVYAHKEKYFARLNTDPDLFKATQVTLPRMSFELMGMTYDPSRKQNSLLRSGKANTATRISSQYMGVPYDLEFELNIYARNIDDGTHIIEQILPYFNPDYTVTVNVIPEIGFLKDVPIILNSVTNSVEHEGNFDAIRYVTWRLTFTMKANYYGPISTPKIIREVNTNIYNDPSLKAGYLIRINTSGGNNGTFKIDDYVYQGADYQTATAVAQVIQWNAQTGYLTIGGAQGQFKVNNTIRAVSTNASYNLSSFDVSPLKLVNINIVPDPITAEPDDDYGYTTTITEFTGTEVSNFPNLPTESYTSDSINIQADSTTITVDKD